MEWAANYLGFLKNIPFLPHVLDSLLRLWLLLRKPQLQAYLDQIEQELAQWPDLRIGAHKYGGIQFNYHQKEIGHLHGDGLLDILYSRETKRRLIKAGKVREHIVFKASGWTSFYIKEEEDIAKAIALLQLKYSLMQRDQIKAAPASP